MATHILNPQQIRSSGTTPTYHTSASTPALATGSFPNTGDQFHVPNDGKTWLHVKTGATAVNVTVLTDPVLDGISLPDLTVAVPANSEREIFPQDRDVYGDPFKFVLDVVTNLEIAVLRA